MATGSAPILSTPAEHILEENATHVLTTNNHRLTDEQLYIQYEIKRTIDEIRAANRRCVALQFPDEMLVDAPRVAKALRKGLASVQKSAYTDVSTNDSPSEPLTAVKKLAMGQASEDDATKPSAVSDTNICILGDTSYGACCVDEVAAEHVNADVVVHYGRACLSPTIRLPVIYVYSARELDLDASMKAFQNTYPDKDEKVCLMADIPFHYHLHNLYQRLVDDGYRDVFETEIIHDPSSPLPNRTVPYDAAEDEGLKRYSLFHISSPPTSLLLTVSSRVKQIHIFHTDSNGSGATESMTTQDLRRRYALVTRLSTVSVFGILINTLSVSKYMTALKHCQDLIRKAGKKSYVFVVGKVNPAKIANFAEIGGWVVIGCWESSLIDSREFFRPIITPFELELALKSDNERVWTGKWISNFSQLIDGKDKAEENAASADDSHTITDPTTELDGYPSDDEPPEFDLRTGRYVSNSRPMGRPKPGSLAPEPKAANEETQQSTALLARARGDVALINGVVSPAAEFLRSKRTWQGLGSDHEIAYERDEDGKIRGAVMEEGRSGVAKGYTVGSDPEKA